MNLKGNGGERVGNEKEKKGKERREEMKMDNNYRDGGNKGGSWRDEKMRSREEGGSEECMGKVETR